MADIENFGFPFDSIEIKEGVGDRGVASVEWAKYVSSMFTDGYIKDPSKNVAGFEPFKVTTQAGMTVSIGKGTILIKGRMKIFTQPAYFVLDQANSQPRIDLICLRLNLNAEERRIYPVVIKGEPSNTPIKPGYIRNDVIYDMVIAKITVPSNVAKLTQDDIVDTRDDTVYCGQSMTSDASELVPEVAKLWEMKADKSVTVTQLLNGLMSAADKTKLDGITAGATAIVTGTYTGDSVADRTINLGFTSKAVLVLQNGSTTYLGSGVSDNHVGGLAIGGFNASTSHTSGITSWVSGTSILGIVANGIRVSYHSTGTISSNRINRVYTYIAFK